MWIASSISLLVTVHAVFRVYTSPWTPFPIAPVLEWAETFSSVSHQMEVTYISSITEAVQNGSDVLLDYTYLEDWSATLESGQDYVKMQMGRRCPCGKGSIEQYGRTFTSYLESLAFSRVLLISNTAADNLWVTQFLLQEYPFTYTDVHVLPEAADLNLALNFTGRLIKPSGITFLAIFTDPVLTRNLIIALEYMKMNKAGFAFVLSQEASYFRTLVSNTGSDLLSSGLVFIAEYPFALTSSLSAFEGQILAAEIDQISTSVPYVFTRNPVWALFSMYESQAFLSALTPEAVRNASFRFPGNSTSIPLQSKATITALVNYQLINPDLSIYPSSPQLTRGFQIAFAEANSRSDLLPNYYLRDKSVNYTGMSFGYNYSLAAVLLDKPSAAAGLIFMTAPCAACIIGMSQIFQELGIAKPITAASLSSILSDPVTYPLYLRPRVANKYLFTVIGRVLQQFDWNHIAVLYAEGDADYQDGYGVLQNYSSTYNLTISNPEKLRALPAVLNNSTVDAVNKAIEAIEDCGTRIILILHNFPYVIMEQMYDLGIRQGYVMLLVGAINDSIFNGPQYKKRRVVSKSAILFIPKTFVGAVGASVKERLVKIDGNSTVPNTCIYYDGAMLYFHATDYLLTNGLDYEDSCQIAAAMRNTYFTGCSGFIKIEMGWNDRSPSEIDLWQFQYDEVNDNYTFGVVAVDNPFAATIFTIQTFFQWPDNGEFYPDLKPQYQDCPYLEEDVLDLPAGRMIALSVCGGIVFLTCAITLLIWKYCWRRQLRMLDATYNISVEDVLSMSNVVADFFEFSAVGPDIAGVTGLIANADAGLSFGLEDFTNLTQGVYWVMLEVVYAMVIVWTLLCILKFTGLDTKLGKLCSTLDYWTDLFMPTLGNMLFLPVVSTLLGVFVCYKSTGPDVMQSFMNRDCYQFCWTGKHVIYVVASSVALLIYIPLAVFTRPLWQDLQANLHIKCQPLALLVKSAIQIILISASVTMKTDLPGVHSYVFCAIVFVYIVFLVAYPQFNYPRLNLWQTIIMCMMLLLEVVAASTESTAVAESRNLLGGLIGSYICMAAAGLVLQWKVKKFESKLERTPGKDVKHLFRFAFTCGQSAVEALEMYNSVNQFSAAKYSARQELVQNPASKTAFDSCNSPHIT